MHVLQEQITKRATIPEELLELETIMTKLNKTEFKKFNNEYRELW